MDAENAGSTPVVGTGLWVVTEPTYPTGYGYTVVGEGVVWKATPSLNLRKERKMGFQNPYDDPGIKTAGCILFCGLLTLMILIGVGLGMLVTR